MLQCVAVFFSKYLPEIIAPIILHAQQPMRSHFFQVVGSVLQLVAVYCNMYSVAVCCSVLQCVAVCCSVLQCAAVCRSVLQRVTACCSVYVSEIIAPMIPTHIATDAMCLFQVVCVVLQCVAVFTCLKSPRQ